MLLNDHTEELDSCIFKVTKDGYYTVDHLIIPNFKWLENASEEYSWLLYSKTSLSNGINFVIFLVLPSFEGQNKQN